MNKFGDWEIVGDLGKGGQSDVYLARTPLRARARQAHLLTIRTNAGNENNEVELAKAIYEYARPDHTEELGALKHFSKIPGLNRPHDLQQQEAVERLKNEIAVLHQNRSGLPKFLDANVDERWIVTELFPEGSLEKHMLKFKGNALASIRVLRYLVGTVAILHEDGYVHRDIKPANVFLRNDEELVLGDFGIVFMPTGSDRVTVTNERVGPRDYMPPWGDLGERLDNVHPNFDVYMLGKLLWCMVTGKLKLPREYHGRDEFDVVQLFPNDVHMRLVKKILDCCVVERPEACLQSARPLLELVDSILLSVDYGVPMLDESGNLVLPCRICGKGFYRQEDAEVRLQTFDSKNRPQSPTVIKIFVCNVCTHRQFFSPGQPREAARRGWQPWRP